MLISVLLMISSTASIANDRDDCAELMQDKRAGWHKSQAIERVWSEIAKHSINWGSQHNNWLTSMGNWGSSDPCIPVITGDISKLSEFEGWVEKNFTSEEQIKEFRKRGKLGAHSSAKNWGNVFLNASGRTALEIVGMAQPTQTKRTTRSYKPSAQLKLAFTRLSQHQRKLLQSSLKELGYYSSSIDGLYGRGTAGALNAYNEEYLDNSNLKQSSNTDKLINDILSLETAKSNQTQKNTLLNNASGIGGKVVKGVFVFGLCALTPDPAACLDGAMDSKSSSNDNYSSSRAKGPVTYNRVGNSIIGSDGSSCNKVGSSWICN